MTGQLIRFGVSIERHLLQQFDRLIDERGYQNRSETIRQISNQLISLKGVKHGKLVMTTTGKNI